MVRTSFGQYPDVIIIVLVTATFLHIDGKILDEMDHWMVPDKNDYPKANSTCLEKGSFLPSLDSNLTRLRLDMRSKQIHSIWVAVRRKGMDRWLWTDNSTASPGDETFYKETGGHCGVIGILEDRLMAHSCSNPHSKIGFICNFTGHTNMTECQSQDFLACITLKGFYLAFSCGSDSWFVARKRCLKSGGDLVLMDTLEKRRDMRDELDRTKLTSNIMHCEKYYVGIRKDKWVSINRGDEKNIDDLQGPWLDKEPSKFHCAELFISNDKLALRTKECMDKNNVLCLKNADIKESQTRNVSVPETCVEEKTHINKLEAGFGAALPIAVIIFVSIVIFSVWKYWCLVKSAKADPRNTRNQALTGNPALTGSQALTEIQAPTGSRAPTGSQAMPLLMEQHIRMC